MTHEIKIYGEVVPYQGTNIERNGFTNLSIIESQIKNAEGKDILARIHTIGGDVDEGFAIYTALRRYAKENNAKIITRADGQVASIGTVIFLAGDERIGNPYVQPFFHKAQSEIYGDDEHIKASLELNEKANQRISLHYSQHTNLTEEEAIELMATETFLSPADSENLRFCTSTEEIQRPKAVLNKQNFQNNNMSEKNKAAERKSILKRIENFLTGAQNKIFFTADNSELDFYELGEDDTPAVGNKAKFDGKPAGDSNDGEYTMPSGEVYKFTGEELTEIVPVDDSSDDLATENQALKDEIATLKASNKKLSDEKGVVNKSLNDAKSIINSFKNFDAQFEDEEDDDKSKRDPKSKDDEPAKSSVSNALKNLKKKNTDGGNK